MLPGVDRQAGLQAGLREKRLAIPSMLQWHLRQQKPATAFHANDEAVPPNLNLFRTHREWRRQDADLDLQLWDFFARDGIETRVVKRRCHRGLRHGAPDRVVRRNVADAPA